MNSIHAAERLLNSASAKSTHTVYRRYCGGPTVCDQRPLNDTEESALRSLHRQGYVYWEDAEDASYVYLTDRGQDLKRRWETLKPIVVS